MTGVLPGMGKHVHRLLSKDLEARTGVCAECGPVDLVLKNVRVASARADTRAYCAVASGEANRQNARKQRERAAWLKSLGIPVSKPPEPPVAAVRHRLLSKDPGNRAGVCVQCGPVVLVPAGRGRLRCANGEYVKNQARVQPHGLTTGQARQFVQGRSCAVCGSAAGLVVDHDHETGQVRGPLCRRHNIGLGCFGDDPELLSAVYLERWQARFMKDEGADIPPARRGRRPRARPPVFRSWC